MASSDLKKLLQQVKHHPENHPELETLDETPQAWQRWARDQGCELTPDEALELMQSRWELGDDDLEQVAGGWSGDEPPPPEGNGGGS